MRRCLLINILLVIAGILLALALFGAGAVWKGRMKPSRPSVSALALPHYFRALRLDFDLRRQCYLREFYKRRKFSSTSLPNLHERKISGLSWRTFRCRTLAR